MKKTCINFAFGSYTRVNRLTEIDLFSYLLFSVGLFYSFIHDLGSFYAYARPLILSLSISLETSMTCWR